jgi:hypothetical protein
MKTYMTMEVNVHAILISVLDGVVKFTLRPLHRQKKGGVPPCPVDSRLNGFQRRLDTAAYRDLTLPLFRSLMTLLIELSLFNE